ncbi:MAG: hypothetical protein AB1847_21175 [bacterium]
MSNSYINKIKQIEQDIAKTIERLTATQQKVNELKPRIEKAETLYREHRKALALSENVDKRGVSEAQKTLNFLRSDLDEAVILVEALGDKRVQLENDLVAAKQALTDHENEILSGKAQKLVDDYTRAITEAYSAAFRLKLVSQRVTANNGSLKFDYPLSTFEAFELVYQGFPLLESGDGGYCRKLSSKYLKPEEIQAIWADLLK